MSAVRTPATSSTQPDRDVDARPTRAGESPTRAEVERVAVGELGRGEPRRGVGAHRLEGDVAEVEQSRLPHDDVQADGHHDEHDHHDGPCSLSGNGPKTGIVNIFAAPSRREMSMRPTIAAGTTHLPGVSIRPEQRSTPG